MEYAMSVERKLNWDYEPAKVIENEEALVLWDKTVYTNKTVTHNRPDIQLQTVKIQLKTGMLYDIFHSVQN